MKINAEIEIDWLSEDENIDEVIKEQILKQLAKKIEDKFTDEITKEIANTAKNFIQAETELIINSTLEKPITITEGWNNKTEYSSIHEMIENKMTELYKGKINSNGSCKEDPLLANLKKYIDTSVNKLLNDVEAVMRRHADNAAKNAVKESELYKAVEHVVKIK